VDVVVVVELVVVVEATPAACTVVATPVRKTM
jgi:hypothetical protein